MLSFISLGKQCLQLPHMTNADTDTRRTEVGTVVTISCHVGFKFPDGSRVRAVVCMPDETWAVPSPPCECK